MTSILFPTMTNAATIKIRGVSERVCGPITSVQRANDDTIAVVTGKQQTGRRSNTKVKRSTVPISVLPSDKPSRWAASRQSTIIAAARRFAAGVLAAGEVEADQRLFMITVYDAAQNGTRWGKEEILDSAVKHHAALQRCLAMNRRYGKDLVMGKVEVSSNGLVHVHALCSDPALFFANWKRGNKQLPSTWCCWESQANVPTTDTVRRLCRYVLKSYNPAFNGVEFKQIFPNTPAAFPAYEVEQRLRQAFNNKPLALTSNTASSKSFAHGKRAAVIYGTSKTTRLVEASNEVEAVLEAVLEAVETVKVPGVAATCVKRFAGRCHVKPAIVNRNTARHRSAPNLVNWLVDAGLSARWSPMAQTLFGALPLPLQERCILAVRAGFTGDRLKAQDLAAKRGIDFTVLAPTLTTTFTGAKHWGDYVLQSYSRLCHRTGWTVSSLEGFEDPAFELELNAQQLVLANPAFFYEQEFKANGLSFAVSNNPFFDISTIVGSCKK